VRRKSAPGSARVRRAPGSRFRSGNPDSSSSSSSSPSDRPARRRVAHVLGAHCHLCVRARHEMLGAGEGNRTLDPNLGKDDGRRGRVHQGYAASFGMILSANRKNRWLRAPATNFTKPRKRLRARPQRQHRRQRAPNLDPQRRLRILGEGIRRISSTKARICSRAAASSPASASCSAATFARYDSPRFGSSRGAGATPAPTRLQRSARGRRVRPSSPSTGR